MGALTRFGEIEILLDQVGHQPKERDPATQDCHHNVEVGQRQRRHLGSKV